MGDYNVNGNETLARLARLVGREWYDAPKRPRRCKRPQVKVEQYFAGSYADGGDNFAPMIRLRGKWIEEVFAVGARVRVTREERAGKLVLVLEEVER